MLLFLWGGGQFNLDCKIDFAKVLLDFDVDDTVQRLPGTMTVTFTVGLVFKLAWCDPCSTSQHLILPPCQLPDDNDSNDDGDD